MSEPVVSASALVKQFNGDGQQTVALKQIDFEAKKGELTALVGPDGAGKTTLLRLVAGLMVPSDGSLRVLGYNTTTDAQQVQNLISYMPQRFGLYEDLSVQ